MYATGNILLQHVVVDQALTVVNRQRFLEAGSMSCLIGSLSWARVCMWYQWMAKARSVCLRRRHSSHSTTSTPLRHLTAVPCALTLAQFNDPATLNKLNLEPLRTNSQCLDPSPVMCALHQGLQSPSQPCAAPLAALHVIRGLTSGTAAS